MSSFPSNATPLVWRFAGREFHLGLSPAAPLLMGIVNTTPDSFSDGGRCLDPDAAVRHAIQLVGEGANIIDIGGESTRPGSDPVPAELELQRVVPVIERLRAESDVVISIDTTKATVARQALAAGAEIINDVSGLRADPEMMDVAAGSAAGVIVMHMLGTPKTMQIAPRYDDVVGEVCAFLVERLAEFEGCGIPRERVALDPGLGFGKTVVHNLRLLRDLAKFGQVGRPICLGPSRKSLVGKLLECDVDQRVFGTIGACVAGYLRGAQILRVHDVSAVRDAITVVRAIELGEKPT